MGTEKSRLGSFHPRNNFIRLKR